MKVSYHTYILCILQELSEKVKTYESKLLDPSIENIDLIQQIKKTNLLIHDSLNQNMKSYKYILLQSLSKTSFHLYKSNVKCIPSLKPFLQTLQIFYTLYSNTLISFQDSEIQSEDNQFIEHLMEHQILWFEYSKKEYIEHPIVKKEAERINMNLHEFKKIVEDIIEFNVCHYHHIYNR